MMNKYFKFFLFFFLCPLLLFSQGKIKDGHKKFYYENGQISSEGNIINGLPEGYWITYYPNGLIKSEGNRVNNLLDSTWIFYGKEGNINSKINFRKGKKSGFKITYSDSCFILLEENFENDLKQGISTGYYDKEGKCKKIEINYIDNIENGRAFEYGYDGRLISLIKYKKGVMMGKEKINRYDLQEKKIGIWKKFYNNGRLEEEATYKNDLLNGYLKEYDLNGRLVKATLYIDGEPQLFVDEVANIDITRVYYPDGVVKSEGVYDVNGKEHGTFKYFDKDGKIEGVSIFSHGFLLAKGLLDEAGRRQEYWEEYYLNEQLKSKGKYKDGEKIEAWEYYFDTGKIEQKGKYTKKGKLTGVWTWYHKNGEILREESFRKGLEDGMLYEYYDDGTLITKGELIDGLKDGPWFYEMGDHKEEGSYSDGERKGVWKYYYPNGKINFTGKFVDGEKDGKHKYYYSSGKIKREEYYVMGIKQNRWTSYNEFGETLLTIDYKEGKEYKIDGTKLKD